MSITLNTKSYSVDTNLSPNKIRYTGPAETLSVKDRFDLGRTYPKPTADYAGNARSQVKTTATLTDGSGNIVGDMIVDTRIQVPVGAASAEVAAVRDDHGDLILSTEAGLLVDNLDINH